ncbi:chemotaxis protein CheW [Thermoanaerobacterium thermosaccharolyticum]|uniref:chemotaxis protein CheW n=1 Tax=Thermoanaerobacterium thermosaccharolyticum TaxID=1517 RepID=UPI0020A238E5|nr:chemotaxis protein CheW [Thermoanaerobacterium thermosaccharolyticum]MCP2241140.1 purine-binding chemotaxis protein CheW [Thermoanaerobacterium thermosaccharolyticum]
MNELLDYQYVVCELCGENYALKINEVFEIIKFKKITYLHNSKSYLEGIINLRGKIVPVINIHRRLGLGDYSNTKSTRIIILNFNDELIGVVVDRVIQVTKFVDIQPTPETVDEIDGNYFEGIGITQNDEVIAIMKIDRLLYAEY